MNNLHTVVIVGRINAGKSSLFNRLTDSHSALVSTVQGTTRDYNIGNVEWQGFNFQLIDTGGVDIDILKNSIQSLGKLTKHNKAEDSIEQSIVNQTKEALRRADLLLLVTDCKTGVLPQDKELVRVLQKIKKPLIIAANKADSPRLRQNANDFFRLGVPEVMAVSAANGSGIGDLLDVIVKNLQKILPSQVRPVAISDIKIAFVGKANAGKSSLVNKILGEKRVIVSSIPHTTREPQNTTLEYKGKTITIIDTAGLRKKGKVKDPLDKAVLNKTVATIKNADIMLLVTEANQLVSRQDSHLAGMAKEYGKGIILVANKWDLVEDKDIHIDTTFQKYYQRSFPFLSFAPLVFVSAETGKNVTNILDIVVSVYEQLTQRVPQEKLDEILQLTIARHKPAQAKGNTKPTIKKISQTGIKPPTFTVTVGAMQSLHFSYLRFIENQIRKSFDFTGSPVRIYVVTQKNN